MAPDVSLDDCHDLCSNRLLHSYFYFKAALLTTTQIMHMLICPSNSPPPLLIVPSPLLRCNRNRIRCQPHRTATQTTHESLIKASGFACEPTPNSCKSSTGTQPDRHLLEHSQPVEELSVNPSVSSVSSRWTGSPSSTSGATSTRANESRSRILTTDLKNSDFILSSRL